MSQIEEDGQSSEGTDVVDSPPSGSGRNPPLQRGVFNAVGEERPFIDEHEHTRYRGGNIRPIPVDEVNRNTEGLVATFFRYQFQRDGHSVPQTIQQRKVIESAAAREISRIGDQVYQRYNYRLDSYISELNISSSESAYEAFAHVASQMFQDGINWGRIVMLFMFGYKLAVHVVVSKSPLIFVIIKWMGRYVMEKLAGWIASHGGWQAICHEYEASAKQFFAVLLIGIAVFAYFRWKK